MPIPRYGSSCSLWFFFATSLLFSIKISHCVPRSLARPSTHVKRVWCTEKYFLSHWAAPILDFETTNQIAVMFTWRKRSYFEPNWKSCLIVWFATVQIDFAAISNFCKWCCVVVHVHWGIRKSRCGFIDIFLWCLAQLHVTGIFTQNTRPSFCFSGRISTGMTSYAPWN